MNAPVLNSDKCTACGLCLEVCGLEVLLPNRGGPPRIDPAAYCNACRHCVAICPQDALSVPQVDPRDPASTRVAQVAAPVAAPGVRTLLTTKRSCREFLNRPVEKDVLQDLVDVARMAPTSINCQERTFIVVTDPGKIEELRRAVTRHTRSLLKLIRLMAGRVGALLLPPDSHRHMGYLKADFEVALRHTEAGDDYIFHNAPCLVFFTGIGMDPSGRDHALGAQHYLMLYAETLGLGTCINGYAQTAPKLLAKHLPVPKGYTIYGAIMLGYRRHTYPKPAHRKPAWVDYVG